MEQQNINYAFLLQNKRDGRFWRSQNNYVVLQIFSLNQQFYSENQDQLITTYDIR